MSFSIPEGFRRTAGLAILGLLITPIFVVSSVQPADAESIIAQIGDDIDGEAAGDESGHSVALSSDGTIVAIGAYRNDDNGDQSGHVRVHQYSGGLWTQLGGDINGASAFDYSGFSVALSSDGTRVAIGAYGHGSSAGHVRVYDWNGTAWVQTGGDIDGEAAGDHSGVSIALSSDGDRLAIGAPFNGGGGTSAGHVRVYDWNGTAWVQKGTDIDGEAAGDQSGRGITLSADGNRLAIGAPGNDANGSKSGHVRVYDWSGTAWTQTGTDIDGETSNDESGWGVSLSSDGSRLAIGEPGDVTGMTDPYTPRVGQVRVFDWNGTTWTQAGTDIDGEALGDLSGRSVSLSADGDRLAIGAPGNDGNGSNAGHVRFYDWSGTAWVQSGDDIDGEAAGDFSGISVALSSNSSRLAIGASYNDGSGANSGHVRIFSITSNTSSSSTTTGISNAQKNTSTPGIFLTVHGQAGDAVHGSELRFGAYSIQPSSPYAVTIRSGNNITTQRILASGTATSAGHLDRTITLPVLPSGNHTVVLTALNTSGGQLILGNTITVAANQTVSRTTPENLQPAVR